MSLTNTQYDEIMRSYQEKQLARQHTLQERRRQIAIHIPEIPAIDREIAAASVRRARHLLSGDADALSGLKEELSALSRKRTDLLVSAGYPEDYLEPPYSCPDCQDTGYIGTQRCHCFRQACIDLVYQQSNLSDILGKENFSTFSLAYYDDSKKDSRLGITSREAAENALRKCRAFTEHFDTNFENILLFGDTGVGKTFLTNCVAKELLDTGHSVLYFSASRLFELLADSMFHRNPDMPFDDKTIYECDLLIIDDLGTEMVNSFTASRFFVCINERLLNRKSTLISSNLDLDGIESLYSERIYSRITSSYILLQMFGQDIRIKKRLNPHS